MAEDPPISLDKEANDTFGAPYLLDKDDVFGQLEDGNSVRAVSRLRESTRGWIAGFIVAALLLIVVLSYVMFTIMAVKNGDAAYSDLKDLTETLLAPVIGIVGAVTGFYFGEKQSGKD